MKVFYAFKLLIPLKPLKPRVFFARLILVLAIDSQPQGVAGALLKPA